MLHLLWKPLNNSGHWYSSAARKEQLSYWPPIWGCWIITWGDNSRHTLPPSLAIFFSPPQTTKLHERASTALSPLKTLYIKRQHTFPVTGPAVSIFGFKGLSPLPQLLPSAVMAPKQLQTDVPWKDSHGCVAWKLCSQTLSVGQFDLRAVICQPML